MKNAKRIFRKAGTERIEGAIAEAERHSSAEIVCAVATESGRYDRAEAIAGLIGSLLGLGIAHIIHEEIRTAPGEWAAQSLALGWQAVAVAVGFVAGHVAASYGHGLRRLFTSRREKEAEVWRAAWHVFGTAAIRGTVQQSGVLVYVSLFEHRVVILADRRAQEALGEERIEAIRDRAVESLKEGEVADGCVAAIEAAGKALRESLPTERDVNENELADHLLLFHPRP